MAKIGLEPNLTTYIYIYGNALNNHYGNIYIDICIGA